MASVSTTESLRPTSSSRTVPATQDGPVAELAGDEGQQLERRQVGPLEVVEHDDQRAVGGGLGQQVGHRLEHPEPGAVAGRRRRRRRRRGRAGSCSSGAAAAGPPRATSDAHDGQPRPERRRGAALEGVAPEDRRAPAPGLGGQLLEQPGLADAGLALDEHDADRRCAPRRARRPPAAARPRGRRAPRPAGVPRRRGRGHDRGARSAGLTGEPRAGRGTAAGAGGGDRLEGQRGVLRQDRGLELDERPARVDAELVAQRATGVVEDAQRLGLTARPVEGERQVVAELLAQRVGGHQLAQLADDGGVAAEAQVGVDAVLGGDQAALLERAANPQAKSRCENSSSAGPRHSPSASSSRARAVGRVARDAARCGPARPAPRTAGCRGHRRATASL